MKKIVGSNNFAAQFIKIISHNKEIGYNINVLQQTACLVEEQCQNAQKQFSIKTYPELILYKPVGKYQFTMACIRALVMIAYQEINCLISQSKHMLWVLKRTVSMRRFF